MKPKIRKIINDSIKKLEKDFTPLNTVELFKDNLLHNYNFFRKQSGNQNIFPVVKSNAYGHGLKEVVTILNETDAPYIVVDGYYEALTIEDITDKKILVMGYIDPVNVANLDFSRFTFVVHDEVTVDAFGKTGKDVNVHLEINTGMNRYGVSIDELDNLLLSLKKYKNIHVTGVMSHLADADGLDISYTKMQEDMFKQAVEKVLDYGYKLEFIHLAQTAGTFKTDNSFCNSARVGIGLYGIHTIDKNDDAYETVTQNLKPVLRLKSTITKVINLKPGEKVSYNCTFEAKRPSRIGVLPLGYYEGVNRELSNKGVVRYKDQDLPIVGRVCMNHTMINLTESDAKYGDEVEVIGVDKTQKNSLQYRYENLNLFAYGEMVHINKNIRRVII